MKHISTFYNNKNTLVTGGCGFIGSHIVEQLVQLGANVTILDNLSSGNIDNIEKVKHHIRFIQDSIENNEACDRATQGQDIIFHLAALISVQESIENPELCHRVNVTGTANILEAARKNNVSTLIFSSSAAIYGTLEGKCKETMQAAPESPYGFSKYIGELYCQQYSQLYGIKTAALRYFNVFGPRQNPEGEYAGVYAAFNQRMKYNKPITIFGDGEQTRDFIAVEQVAQANILMATHDKNILNGQAFNIATGNSISLNTLVKDLRKKHTHYSQEITYAPARNGDIRNSCAENTKYHNSCKSLLIPDSTC